jgi:glycosyltransferase involved in cell wall biosynthesis
MKSAFHPRVTVIIPTYNRAHLISRAIESVINQTYSNWELLVVDDASTDNTEQIVKEYLSDSRIKYIKATENGGNAVARNLGVNAAKGEYISFVDSDDEYHKEYLFKALHKLESSSNDIYFLWAGTKTVGIDGNEKDIVWVPKRKNHPNQFLYELHVGIGRGFLIKKDCFKDLKFDNNLRTAVDTDFLIRLRQNYNFTVLEEVLLTIHTQPESVRSNHAEKKKSYKIIIDKHKTLIDNDKYLRSKFYYKLFWLSLYSGDNKLAEFAYKKIAFSSIKPTLLYVLFNLFDNEKAIELHKKLSN